MPHLTDKEAMAREGCGNSQEAPRVTTGIDAFSHCTPVLCQGLLGSGQGMNGIQPSGSDILMERFRQKTIANCTVSHRATWKPPWQTGGEGAWVGCSTSVEAGVRVASPVDI